VGLSKLLMATSASSPNVVKTGVDKLTNNKRNMAYGKKKKSCPTMDKIKRVKKSPRKILASKK